MARPGAIIRASKAMPGVPGAASPTPAPQGSLTNASYFGQMSPLARDLAEQHNYASAYPGYLPRPGPVFTQGAFGPFAPILPSPVDEPPDHAERPEPRRWQFEPGWNLPVGQPGTEGLKLADFKTLQTLADLYSVARTCIQLRKAEIRGMDWDVVPTHEASKAYHGDREAMRDFGERRAQVVKFFRQPDPNYFSWNTWLDAVLEEIFVFDALSILIRPKWGGKGYGLLDSDLDSLELINGPTIRPLVGMHGEIPRPPSPAYQQYLYGVPRSDLMTMITHRDIEDSGLTGSELKQYRGDQLLYLPMVPRTWTPYGFPPMERALIPVMTGLQKQAYQLDYFREGTVPAVYISPGDPNMTPNQIRELQDALNAIAGDPAWKHKIIVLPYGSKVDPQKQIQLADQFDEIVMTQVCMAYDVNPMELGILPKVSAVASPFAAREMAQSQRSIQERKSTKPLMKFISDIVNGILHRVVGQDDMKFIFEGMQEEADQAQVTDLLVKQVQNGIRSVDEAREELELEPWGLPETSGPIVFTSNGPMPFGPLPGGMQVQGAQRNPAATPIAPAGPPSQGGPGGPNGTPPPNGMPRAFQPALEQTLTPAHEIAEGHLSQGMQGGNAPRPPMHRGGTAQRGAAPDLMKDRAALNELEALTRHLAKGRDPVTWESRYLPWYAPYLIANSLSAGVSPQDAEEHVKTIILGSEDYTWGEKTLAATPDLKDAFA